jgi:hypothetical protein
VRELVKAVGTAIMAAAMAMAADMDEHVNKGKLLDVVECNCHKYMATKLASV